MPQVQNSQYNYPVQSTGTSPVSPFANKTNTATPAPTGFTGDSLKTQPLARGIQPNVSLLHEKQSTLSPFHRPNGGTVDFLKPEPAPTNGQTAPQTPTAPKQPEKIIFTFPVDIPEGPAAANIQQTLMQELQGVQHPQQALQMIEGNLQEVQTSRETANRITWGARYYAVQAAETAEQALAQWPKLNPQQKQQFVAKVHEYRDQAVGLLNEAKKHSISTYNGALKANLIYNHFFTATGTMINVLDDNARGTVKNALNDGWSRWNGSFQKEWQGQTVEAKGIMHIIDETSNEVANHVHRMNSVLSQLN